MTTTHTTVIEQHHERHTGTVARVVGALRHLLLAFRESGERIVIRGQLGPSVGHRHDRGPERYL